MKKFLKGKNKVLIIALAVAVGLSVFGYAMTVNGFNDYNPPSSIWIDWRDYLTGNGSPTINNVVSERPVWSAEYPYRTILYGAKYVGGTVSAQKHNAQWTVIYSKKPTTDLFTFQYHEGSRQQYDQSTLAVWGKRGYIRAYFNYNAYDSSDDVVIRTSSEVGVGVDLLLPRTPSSFNNIDWNAMGLYRGYWNPYFGDKDCYIDFDFYYECTAEHQNNAYTLNVNGLRSVPNVPYAYILKCDNHGAPAGSTSGSGGSGSSGGSSGGSSSGSSSRPSWGNGEYGSGVDKNSISSVSVPDDWKKPVEDDYNGGLSSEYKPDIPEYKPAEGDTGQNGEDWELPEFNIDNDGVTGTINGEKEIKSNGEQGYIEMKPGGNGWGAIDLNPDGSYGLIDFLNMYGG